MREHPILFNGPMVRAIVGGQKTQTRRLIQQQPFDRSWSRHDHRICYMSSRASNGDEVDGFHAYSVSSGSDWRARCPFGQPGDRLWVRETWTHAWDEERNQWTDPERYHYRADGVEVAHVEGIERSPWIPSIHMPRRACRLVLEITAVRVERLQAISAPDALAEGAMEWAGEQDTPIRDLNTGDERIAFAALWDSTGGIWDSNPWVWVIEFKRLEVAHG